MSLVSIRKKGYLYKLPVKGFVKKWNRRWFVLHCTTIEGIVRLEYFDSESYEATGMGKRTIPLRQCRDISPTGGTKKRPYVFQFSTHMGHHVFAADSHTDMEEWMSSMQEAIMEDRQRNRRKKAQSLIIQQSADRNQSLAMPGTTAVPVAISQEAHHQDTMYEPSNSGTYRVTLEQNESTRRLKFTGLIYNLEITSESVTLVAADSGTEVALWKYKQIRTYGKSSGKFNFECGRTAETGQGNFVFKTTCAKEIFGVVHHNIKRIRAQMEEAPQGGNQGGRLTKQVSLPTQTQLPNPPTDTTDYRTHQQEPMKPKPYKQKRGGQNMSVGTYRLSKEIENPPSYEEIAAAEPIKEEEEKEKPTNMPAHEEPPAGEVVYSVVDKSKKKKRAQPTTGVPQQSATTQNLDNVSDPFSEYSATNDRSAASGGANQSNGQQQASFENPFQLDPFSFSPQSGGNASFQADPGTDPFVVPPLPAGMEPAPGNTFFDDLGQLDSSAGGGFDIFNFGPPITTEAGPSANGQPTLPPVAGNPLSDISNPTGLNFDVDLLDDRLFDTLAQLDIQDGSGSNEMKEDLAGKGQMSADDKFEFSSPQPQPSFARAGSGAGASGGRKKQSKKLSQQDFDNLWDGICATLPTTDS